MSADDDALGAPWREMEHDPSALLLPVRLRGIAVGRLGVRSGDGRAISEDDRQLLEEFVRQVAEALERARLFEETELARMQTNALFSGSERVVRAASITEALVALVESTRLQEMDRVNILFFDHPWEDVMPENMTVTAVWERSGRSALVPVGTSYPMAYYPATKYLSKEDPLVINNVGTDPRMDEVTRNLFMNRLGMNSVMIFPVVVGDQFIGIITAQASNPTQLSLADVRQISSLADQASAVVQTQRLFDQTRVRAQQERVLREVSEKVYGAVDAETIMRTAVQEVGRALGLQAFVYLENKSNGHSEPHEQ
jgi:GAF domain-containing protein